MKHKKSLEAIVADALAKLKAAKAEFISNPNMDSRTQVTSWQGLCLDTAIQELDEMYEPSGSHK